MADSTLAIAGLVVTIGLADSLNPSTIGPATALAIQPDGARRAAAFTAGVAAVSLAAGLVLVAGPGEAIMAALPHPSHRLRSIAELALGLVLLALALAAWLGRHRLARALAAPEEGRTRRAGLAAPLGLGAAIMAVELPTAFPYFGALAAIVGSKAPLLTQLLLVAVRIAAGERGGERLERFRLVLARYAGIVLAGLLAVAGLVLVALGLKGLTPIG
jgi:cytochrome c biogenesis protein CcdA